MTLVRKKLGTQVRKLLFPVEHELQGSTLYDCVAGCGPLTDFICVLIYV